MVDWLVLPISFFLVLYLRNNVSVFFSPGLLAVGLFSMLSQLCHFLSYRAQASLPGFQVLPLRQFGSWGPEITSKFDPQKDTYVLVCTYSL